MQSPRLTPTICPALKIFLPHCPAVNPHQARSCSCLSTDPSSWGCDAQNLSTINTHKLGVVPVNPVAIWCQFCPSTVSTYNGWHPLGPHQHLWWHPNHRFNWQRPSEDAWRSIQSTRGCWCISQNVEYLGHRISAEELQPTDPKVKTVKDVLVSRNLFSWGPSWFC